VLHGLGGVCQWRGGASRRDRILISLAGPGAGLALGVPLLIVLTIVGWPAEFFSREILTALVIVNIGWSVFNLLPIWPLDGGHVVRDWLAGRRERQETLQLSLQISMLAAGIGAVVGFFFGQIFVVALLAMILWSNYNELKRMGQQPPRSFYGY
jgi:stage IV sporulation protein FB